MVARGCFAIDDTEWSCGVGFSGGSAAHYGHCRWFCSRPRQQQQQGNCRQDWGGACSVVTGGNARGGATSDVRVRGRVVGNLLRRDRNPALQFCAVSRCGGAVLPVSSSLVPPIHRGCGYAYSRQCRSAPNDGMRIWRLSWAPPHSTAAPTRACLRGLQGTRKHHAIKPHPCSLAMVRTLGCCETARSGHGARW